MQPAEPNPRDAVVARREQIADEPRPKPLYVMGGRLTDQPPDGEIYRLYRPEWVVMYTAVHDPHSVDSYRPEDLAVACADHFRLRYAGRVADADTRVDLDDAERPTMARLMLRLPTMKGEFKHPTLAYEFGRDQGWDEFTVVERNSQADHELRAYGTKKLPGR